MKRIVSMVAMVIVLCASVAQADVWMPSVFSDNMVLQRGKPVPVWGWADPGENVTVKFGGQKKKAKADKSGKWMVRLDVMQASTTGRTLVVKGQRVSLLGRRPRVEFENVVVGEVWLCSGQSNMEWRLNQCESKAEAMARADYPLIRLFNVANKASPLPMRDVGGTWEVCSPDTAGAFSGVGFFFGERLFKAIDVPIGLIGSEWGGTRIEPWTPPAGFSSQKSLEKDAAFIVDAKAKHIEALKQYDMGIVRKWADEADAALASDKDVPRFPQLPKGNIGQSSKPTAIFNGMIAPLVPYAMRGTIWYQGESNMGDGMLYRDRMEALITSWRKLWGGEPFPFYYVQLCSYYWGYGNFKLQGIWEAQAAALGIPNTGIAGTFDIAEPWTIHPRNKFDVGNRLALWALAKDYGQKHIVYSGPIFKSMKIKRRKAIVSFDHAGDGLQSLDGEPLSYLVIAGEDKVFCNADVEIDGDKLILSSKKVRKPIAVRYGWWPTAQPNLGNSGGLPAIAFRTDDWEEVISTPRLGNWHMGAGEWSVAEGVYTQADDSAWAKLFTGIQDWRNYTFEVEAKKTGGDAMLIYFRVDKKGAYRWNVGGWAGKKTQIQTTGGGSGSKQVDYEIENDTWYTLKIVAKDEVFELFVDGKSILVHTDKNDDAHKTGGVGIGGLRNTAQFRNMKLTDESGKVLFEDK
jgi:sialate O-acetylesterase